MPGSFFDNKVIKNFNMFQIICTGILLIGILLRAKAYFTGYTLWLDECSLSLSIIHRSITGFFTPLEHTQSAPALFMILTKLITNIFGINEFSLRFIPFTASVIALPVFYIFSGKFLNKKHSIIIAFLLFCINYHLIYYCSEFKQYSSDVLICMSAFLFFSTFNLLECGYKKTFLCGLGIFIAFLFSLPVIFITGGFILYGLINTKKNIKKAIVFLMPTLIFMPIYYLYVLYPSKLEMMETYKNLWQSGFITLNPLSIIVILRENISYFFSQSRYALFGAILLIMGFICIIKNIKQNNRTYLIFLFTFVCIITASFLEIYPIKERVALYLLPFFLVLIVKPLDCINFKDIKNIVKSSTVILLFLFFISSYNIQYFKDIYKNIEIKKGGGDKLMRILKEGFQENDIVVFNDASAPIYKYNSIRHNFKNDRFIMIKSTEGNEEYYIKILNSLPKGYKYWFYYPNQYSHEPVIPFVEKWTQNKDIINSYKINSAYLVHLRIK